MKDKLILIAAKIIAAIMLCVGCVLAIVGFIPYYIIRKKKKKK